ncbi:hypothetical protein [Thioalkalivibrio sp. ALMg11]|uniref:hypothetical protein n=1 Tax=Thioalkalivibrio sp. ALMg11 TaxID=1158165 RepID=UPI00037EBC0B|nr:hypothetical protein [Thioalkalivibrio sp. ALMg11]
MSLFLYSKAMCERASVRPEAFGQVGTASDGGPDPLPGKRSGVAITGGLEAP